MSIKDNPGKIVDALEGALRDKIGFANREERNNGDARTTWAVALPHSIYAVAMIAPVLTGKLSCRNTFLFWLPVWTVLYVCMAAQAGTLYYVSEIVEHDGGVDCDASPYYLQLIALLLYSNLVWVDIFETIKLTSYLFWIPTVASWTDLNVFATDFKGTPVAFAAGHGMTSW